MPTTGKEATNKIRKVTTTTMNIFTKFYALPWRGSVGETFSVKEESFSKYVIGYDDAERLAAQQYLICVRAEENPDLVFWDYDNKTGKDGAGLYAEHLEEFPEFFNKTLTYTTRSPGGMRAISLAPSIQISAHPYKGTKYGDALEFFHNTKRWIVVPPTLDYGQWVNEEALSIPEALEKTLASQSRVVATEAPTGHLETLWTPRELGSLPEHKRPPKVFTDAGRRNAASVICDCGPFYYVNGGQSIQTTRHSQFFRLVTAVFEPLVAKGKMVGPSELNKAYTLLNYYNDMWQCPQCSRKFGSPRDIVRDIERTVSQMPGVKWWTTNMETKPQSWLVENVFYTEPHETVIAGAKGAGKSRLSTFLAKQYEEATGNKVVYLTMDEPAAKVLERHPSAIVYSTKNNRGTTAEYVWENEGDIEQVLERALDACGVTEGILVIEPWTHFYKGLSSSQDDYNKAYEAVGRLNKLAPGFHTILAGHTAKGIKEDRGAEAILGTTGLAGSTRFGYNVLVNDKKQRVVSTWGNDQPEEKYLGLEQDNVYRLEPFEELDVHSAVKDLLAVGRTLFHPLLKEQIENDYGVTLFVHNGFITTRKANPVPDSDEEWKTEREIGGEL